MNMQNIPIHTPMVAYSSKAVIYEGLRIHAPFAGTVPKEVPPGGDTINGMFIPEGTNIAANIWGLLRRQDVYGQDVELFRPERFLVDIDTRQMMERNTELAFGYGRWACAGKPVAFMELNKVFVEVRSIRYP
jgi:cytochrome P450